MCKANAYSTETLVFVGIALDGILHDVSSVQSIITSSLTAIGFASVLTNSEVIFSVRDMLS